MIFALSVVVAGAGALVTYRALGRWPRLHAARSDRVVWVLAAASAALALPESTAPTGNPVLDTLYRSLFAAAVTVAASKARRWAWIVAAGVVVIADHGAIVGIPAGAGLGVALGTSSNDRPGRVVGASVGLVVAEGALRMRWPHQLGATALLAVGVLLVLGLSHLRRLRSRDRRRIWAGAGVVLGLAVAAVGLYGAAAWSVRSDARTALDQAQAALAAARSGQTGASSHDLQTARAAVAAVAAKTDEWWDRPAAAVPAVAQNVRAVQVVVAQAGVVLDAAGGLLGSAQARKFEMDKGTVDLSRVEALTPQLETSRSVVTRAAAALKGLRSVWLASPLRSRVDRLDSKLVQTAADESVLTQASRELPSILGSGGPRRWLLAVFDNSELRGGGGLMGDVGQVVTDHGHVSLVSLEPVGALTEPPGGAKITGPADYLARYSGFQPGTYIADDAYSPDFPTDAQVLEEVYPQWGGVPVSGVIEVDPIGLAALLKLTGPVSAPNWPTSISADNVAPVLLHDQYVALTGTARDDFLVGLAKQVFDHLTAGQLPGPGALASTLGPAALGHHFQLYSNDPGDESLFDRLGLSGRMKRVGGDYLEVVTQNASEDKGDWYLTRSISYSADFDPSTGGVTSRLALAIHNSAPASGEPEYILGGSLTPQGYDRQWVSIYTPLALASASLAGRPVTLQRERELGRNVYSGYVTIPPGGSQTLSVALYGVLAGAPSYRLDVGYQPASHPDSLVVRVDEPGQSHPFRRHLTQARNEEFTVPAPAAAP